jgi:tRNA-2-methylthio-N6-dimethylallyladenosine synthase
VHVATGSTDISPGDTITSAVTYAAPHHLVADAGIRTHRRWVGPAEPVTVPKPLLTIGPPPTR